MKLFRWFGCIVGRHRRDGRQVVHDGIDFRGPCKGCGRPMIRLLSGKWVLARGEHAPRA